VLQELLRRHQELEVTLALERGRRKACQEIMERAAIVQREPVTRESGPIDGSRAGSRRLSGLSELTTEYSRRVCGNTGGRGGSAGGVRYTGDA